MGIKKNIPYASDSVVEALNNALKNPYIKDRVRARARIALKRLSGMTLLEVQKDLGFGYSSVARWSRVFLSHLDELNRLSDSLTQSDLDQKVIEVLDNHPRYPGSSMEPEISARVIDLYESDPKLYGFSDSKLDGYAICEILRKENPDLRIAVSHVDKVIRDYKKGSLYQERHSVSNDREVRKKRRSVKIPPQDIRINKALQRIIRSNPYNKDIRTKAKILLLAQEEKTQKEISDVVGISVSVISKVIYKFAQSLPELNSILDDGLDSIEEYILSLIKRKPRPLKIDYDSGEKIIKLACSLPGEYGYPQEVWNYSFLTQAIMDLHIYDFITIGPVKRFLDDLDFTEIDHSVPLDPGSYLDKLKTIKQYKRK